MKDIKNFRISYVFLKHDSLTISRQRLFSEVKRWLEEVDYVPLYSTTTRTF